MGGRNKVLISDFKFKLIFIPLRPDNPKGINTEESQRNLLDMIRVASELKQNEKNIEKS